MNAIRAFLVASVLSTALAVLAAEPVNINTADAQTLATLEGIGEKRAQAIIEYRSRHGPFVSIEDLIKVKGIGVKTLEKNRDSMTVE
jgi:competence protein ComEA